MTAVAVEQIQSGLNKLETGLMNPAELDFAGGYSLGKSPDAVAEVMKIENDFRAARSKIKVHSPNYVAPEIIDLVKDSVAAGELANEYDERKYGFRKPENYRWNGDVFMTHDKPTMNKRGILLGYTNVDDFIALNLDGIHGTDEYEENTRLWLDSLPDGRYKEKMKEIIGTREGSKKTVYSTSRHELHHLRQKEIIEKMEKYISDRYMDIFKVPEDLRDKYRGLVATYFAWDDVVRNIEGLTEVWEEQARTRKTPHQIYRDTNPVATYDYFKEEAAHRLGGFDNPYQLYAVGQLNWNVIKNYVNRYMDAKMKAFMN
jgi:hypothetical protein